MTDTPSTESSTTEGQVPPLQRFFRALGPAIIVACVVLGPGSILTASKVGCQYGYQLVWVPLVAGLLMVSAVALAARLGVTCDQTPCSELATGIGRPAALLVGVCVFLIATCFQFSNNLGVLAAIEPLFPEAREWSNWLLVGGNLVVIAALFGMKRLYLPLEKLMMILVGVMLIAFAANLFYAQPTAGTSAAGVRAEPARLADRESGADHRRTGRREVGTRYVAAVDRSDRDHVFDRRSVLPGVPRAGEGMG